MQQTTYKGIPIGLSADFSAETLQARREWHDIVELMKGKKVQPRILGPQRLYFRFGGQIKILTDKKKYRRIHHQTSFTTNVKRTYLGRKGHK